ncbi:hypothetical protein C3F09_00440 [candidate division GN15 bacterium]|uniref:Glycosyltransferase RgtA/B/C/D-like domain-containing protein n=1 Tax=candidate division GN15 bacterium TaxID=2072418 RepID=A0A855XCP0_9BACT|nr:MAG: hypothetical protein C3F09_00440 [candidate division GN15 bacterium]
MFTRYREYLFLLPAMAVFAFLAWRLNFTQDDAYISYRYVANFLNGHGLVYNIGERVEGFTNFGWVVYLILWGGLGIGYIAVSKITGFLCGAAVIVVTHLIAREVFGGRENWWRYLPAYLVGANLSLAYWSPAGLETAAFVLSVSLAILWFLQRSRLLIAALVMAVWFRPEGAVICALLILIEAIVERRIPRFTLYCVGTAFVLSLPYVGFKLLYYGSILPNPFYAKTGVSWQYITSGAEYAGEFFRHYGFLGIGLFILLLYYRKLNAGARSLWWFMVGYTIYIVMIGGDVLKVHRFFLPIVGVSATLAVLAIVQLSARTAPKFRHFAIALVGVALVGLTLYLPFKTVTSYNYNERAFTTRLSFLARQMVASDPSPFSAAIPTIGIFGYELLGHDVVDMLGLTDSTVARHSDPEIPDMVTTWKEKRHNSVYLLSRAPDYIVFSTGAKPSAPAEKALLLYPQFLESYRFIAWFYQNATYNPRGSLAAVFKKVRPITGEIRPTYPVAFVEDYKLGQDAVVAGDANSAAKWLKESLNALGTRRPWPELLWSLGYNLVSLRDPKGFDYLNEAVALDSMAFGPQQNLYLYEVMAGNAAKAAVHREYVERLAPWYVKRLDSLAAQAVERRRRAVGQ